MSFSQTADTLQTIPAHLHRTICILLSVRCGLQEIARSCGRCRRGRYCEWRRQRWRRLQQRRERGRLWRQTTKTTTKRRTLVCITGAWSTSLSRYAYSQRYDMQEHTDRNAQTRCNALRPSVGWYLWCKDYDISARLEFENDAGTKAKLDRLALKRMYRFPMLFLRRNFIETIFFEEPWKRKWLE